MARVAAIDIGTNAVLLLVAETSSTGARALADVATITRLGQGVDRTRALASDARARTLACLERYAGEIARAGVVRVDVVGTSALRDAGGAGEFLDAAERILGVRPRVIDGMEEATLTFAGALSGLDVEGELLVFDVGGGSTEVVHGSRNNGTNRVRSARSLDVGSVRLFERHVTGDPPDTAELERVREDVRAALGDPPAGAAATLVGVAGTLTTLAAIEHVQTTYDATRVHGARLSLPAVTAIRSRLGSARLAERRGIPGLEAGRADVIVVGAVIVEEVMRWAGATQLVVSDRGVRWGLALAALAAHGSE